MREPTSPALWIIPAISAAILALSASLLREASQIAPLAHELNRVCGGVLLECARLFGVVLFVGVICAGSAVMS